MSDAVEQLTLFDLDICAGRMYPEPSPAEPQKARTSVLSWRKLLELKTVPVQCLDLTPGHGNLLGQSFWEINSAWLGVSWTLSTGVSPSVAKRIFLVADFAGRSAPQILFEQDSLLGNPAPSGCQRKELPFQLKQALQVQAGVMAVSQEVSDLKAYHINQRDEGIDLHGFPAHSWRPQICKCKLLSQADLWSPLPQIKEMRCVISTMWPLHSGAAWNETADFLLQA